MCNDNGFGHFNATDQQKYELAQQFVDDAWAKTRPELIDAVYRFMCQRISPQALFALESMLLVTLRSLGQRLLELTLQSLQPRQRQCLPENLQWQCGGYRRRNDTTRNANVATLFGNIVLWRTGYRSWQRGEKGILPLEIMLGLTQSVTPALLNLMGQTYAATGSSQNATLQTLSERCGVRLGAERLIACMDSLSESMERLRQSGQVDALVECLRLAVQSKGNRKPVLSVGRDGITLRENRHSFYEIATTATVSVYDRAGKRLQTIYLGWVPELGQSTMDTMLTSLVQAVLAKWDGPLPRLAYVTDSGSNEVSYFENVLRWMTHPRTGERLEWKRVADFYHASERVWSLASALFTARQEQQRIAWAKKMLKKLKKPNGASRVLHSAAALYHRRKLGKTRQEDYKKAYRYIQSRTKLMCYAWCRRYNVPCGSGVTEAGCKTLFTQRLKLSGMRWSEAGARRVLALRTVMLSGTWTATFAAHLDELADHRIRPYRQNRNERRQNAA
jgi:hypothetical protein